MLRIFSKKGRGGESLDESTGSGTYVSVMENYGVDTLEITNDDKDK
jgi:hypothetical protein